MKNKFTKKYLAELFNLKTNNTLYPTDITNTLLQHCWNTTKSSREYMETHPNEPQPKNTAQYSGKMDHSTAMSFVIGDNSNDPFMAADMLDSLEEKTILSPRSLIDLLSFISPRGFSVLRSNSPPINSTKVTKSNSKESTRPGRSNSVTNPHPSPKPPRIHSAAYDKSPVVIVSPMDTNDNSPKVSSPISENNSSNNAIIYTQPVPLRSKEVVVTESDIIK